MPVKDHQGHVHPEHQYGTYRLGNVAHPDSHPRVGRGRHRGDRDSNPDRVGSPSLEGKDRGDPTPNQDIEVRSIRGTECLSLNLEQLSSRLRGRSLKFSDPKVSSRKGVLGKVNQVIVVG